jgi:hypothetical protein
VSLPNGTVAMEFGHCSLCPPATLGAGVPHGINCGGCGHHFHIGENVLIETTPVFCPRCEGACLPFEIVTAVGGSA